MEYNVYDFDKTLYEKDSTIAFYVHCLKKRKTLIRFLPIQVFYLMLFRFCKKDKYKEKFFIFLKDIENIEKEVYDFWQKSKNKIRYSLIEDECKKIVISASPRFLLTYICKELGIDVLIATEVNSQTGKFESKNCHDKEKVNRLKQEIPNCKINQFYSDSYSDEFLAKEAKEAFIVDSKGRKKEWKCSK